MLVLVLFKKEIERLGVRSITNYEHEQEHEHGKLRVKATRNYEQEHEHEVRRTERWMNRAI